MSRHKLALGLILFATACARRASEFDGTWVLRVNGQNILKMTLETEDGVVTGSITKPKALTIDQDGDVTALGPDQASLPVQKSKLDRKRLELTIDGDLFVMTLIDRNRATLALESIHPLNLERAPGGSSSIILATSLPERAYPKEIQALREKLRAMVKEDQDARLAFDNRRTEAADKKNRPVILEIYGKYGWVTKSLAGKDAAHDFWLLVQHQTPEVQQKFLPSLEKAAKSGDASMTDYAYLYDRVQFGQGKPQHWGTQAKCENGKPVLAPVDDLAGLDARRKELSLPPVSEYLKMDYLVESCKGSGR